MANKASQRVKQLESELQESRSEVSLLQVALRRKEEQHQQQSETEHSTPLSLPTTLPTLDSLVCSSPPPPPRPQPFPSTLGSPKAWTSFVLERSGTVDLDLTSKSILDVTQSLDSTEWEKNRPSREQETYDSGVMKGVRSDVEKLGENDGRVKRGRWGRKGLARNGRVLCGTRITMVTKQMERLYNIIIPREYNNTGSHHGN